MPKKTRNNPDLVNDIGNKHVFCLEEAMIPFGILVVHAVVR